MRMRSFLSDVASCFLLTILSLFLLIHEPVYAQIIEEYEGVHIEIDVYTNQLKIFLNTHEIFTFDVATGKNIKETPLGMYRIVTKVKEPWYLPKQIPGGSPKNPLGTRWMGLDVPGTNGYKYGIHGTNNPNSIGRYATQGCIRLHNRDVEWLYQHIPKNTIVIIKNSALTR